MPVGSCGCGAVYAFDVTGHNLGSAFIEALVFGCNMDWDLAWNLYPEEDYLESLVENYDLESHYIVPSGSYEGRRISGALYFIRLQKDIREATGEAVQKRLDQKSSPLTAQWPAEKIFSKKEVEELAASYQINSLMMAAGKDKKIVRHLQRLLYSGDDLLRSRAADILGNVSSVIARRDPGAISNLLQILLNSLSTPGSAGWGSIDAAGEIIGRSPDLFAGFIPAMYQFLGDESLRPGILRALGRISMGRPDLIRNLSFRVMPLLGKSDPETLGYTAWLLGNLGAREAVSDLEKISGDQREIDLYNNGEIEKHSVGRLAKEALQKIKNPEARSQKPE